MTSVAMLFAAFASGVSRGAVTVTPLAMNPPAAGEIVAVTVCVTDAPGGSVTNSAISPVPLVVPVAPEEKTAVQVTPVRNVGNMSFTAAPVAVTDPAAFATTMVYVTFDPGRNF